MVVNLLFVQFVNALFGGRIIRGMVIRLGISMAQMAQAQGDPKRTGTPIIRNGKIVGYAVQVCSRNHSCYLNLAKKEHKQG